jgi:hypothetical protein
MNRLLLSISAFALLLGGCGGGGAAGGGSAVPPQQQQGNLPGFLRVGARTPAHPPRRRHQITGADRARARAGGWQPIASTAPFDSNGPGTAMLMTDGTVMVQDSCSPNWFSLAPDSTGNYVTGKWTKKASMPSSYGPLYFASAVLADGKLIVNGGEYNFCVQHETTLGAMYDPVADKWTAVTGPSGWSSIGDGQSAVLTDGTYMLGNCCTSVQALLDESTMTWTQVGNNKQDANAEEGWTLLRNGTVLTVNVLDPPFAQAYVPKSATWTSAGQLPVDLISGEEIGPQELLPNGTVFVAGANGKTAVYHPSNGTWVLGPTFPIAGSVQLDAADGPATVLTNGTVLLPASPGLYKAPATLFIFNGKKLAAIPGPPNAPNDSTYNMRLMMLPTGQVLETDGSADVEIYTPANKAIKVAAPAITSVPSSLTHGNTYTIKGTRFNGMSQTNAYGDDAQEATNYPLVRIVNNATGHTVYARTHDHSYMGVGSGRVVSTSFDVPATIETGASTLVVVANGVASAPAAVTIH